MSEITKELIEALKDALGFLEAVCFNTPNPKKRKDYADAASRSRAAIAKAEAILATDDDWIPWAGGDCPVGSEVVTKVKVRGGDVDAGKAHFYDWHHDGSACDIVAYRVVKP